MCVRVQPLAFDFSTRIRVFSYCEGEDGMKIYRYDTLMIIKKQKKIAKEIICIVGINKTLGVALHALKQCVGRIRFFISSKLKLVHVVIVIFSGMIGAKPVMRPIKFLKYIYTLVVTKYHQLAKMIHCLLEVTKKWNRKRRAMLNIYD